MPPRPKVVEDDIEEAFLKGRCVVPDILQLGKIAKR
jgi:hypothetical protein